MESAKRWMNTEETANDDDGGGDDDSDDDPNNESLSYLPQDRHETTMQHNFADENEMKRRRLTSDAPESLPFLRDTNPNVADIIIEEELRAKRNSNSSQPSNNDETWQFEEVVNFFRGLHVHGTHQNVIYL